MSRPAGLVALLLTLLAVPLALAQSTTPPAAAPAATPFRRGEIVDPVPSLTDPEQSYALYLPSTYSIDRRWPILFILDARGRGEMAAELFREGAETYGWIVFSSNNSASDGPWEPNERVIRALLADADRRFAVDPRRAYVAGFSGTARGAWAIGLGLPDAVAGVIAASGGSPQGAPPAADLPFAVFATAGAADFNYQEMRTVAERLDALGLPHRLAIFAGRHGWPPPEDCAEAVAWLELQAMRTGRRPRDEALVEALFVRWLERARAAEADGDPLAAYERFREVARDFAGLRDVAAARAAAERLAASEAVTSGQAARRRAAGWEEARRRQVGELVAALQAPGQIPSPQVGTRAEALIRNLNRQAGAESDPHQAAAARRVLEHFFSLLSFYLPRDFLARGDHARALIPLALAVEIREDNPWVWYNLACAEARAGSKRRALDALERAVGAGFADRAHLEADDDLAPLRADERFREIVETMRP